MADGKERGRSHYGSAPSVCVFNDDKVRDAPQGMNEVRGVEKNVGKRYKKALSDHRGGACLRPVPQHTRAHGGKGTAPALPFRWRDRALTDT